MPMFNLDEYELVEDRIRRFLTDYEDGRIVTQNITSHEERAKGYFVVEARIYVSRGDQELYCPKATGLAFEIEGGAGANKTAALENAETSAIGRALANMDYAKGKRPSREEMEKAAKGPQKPAKDSPVPEGLEDSVKAVTGREELQKLWDAAVAGGYSAKVKQMFADKGKEFADEKPADK